MKLTFLGTGTSTGVPQLGCRCEVCMSDNPLDTRSRCSAVVETGGRHLLIDCGPDFYQQMLRYDRFAHLDMAMLTHNHTDHMGGIDDLRPFCSPEGFPIYCAPEVHADIKRRIPYSFAENPYPGVPHFDVREISPFTRFEFEGVEICPLRVIHGKMPILGFRIGENLAYITDASELPDETINEIKGIDTLVINALRIEPHHSHMSLSESLSAINHINPRVAYLTHMSHQIGLHNKVERTLPPNVALAYDGMHIQIPSAAQNKKK
ncbi:MAG: MBL fold metallo-hydrolase [Muribaculaceae bacterium]|nr:MBL fold metallo-hydrolase [Muribaculaceae bacterium]